MTTDETKHWMRTAWKTFGSRDAGRIAALFTDSAEWHAPADNATPLALHGPHHLIGRERIAHFLAHEMHTLFNQIEVEIRGVYADGDTVIIGERFRAQLPRGKPSVERTRKLGLAMFRTARLSPHLRATRNKSCASASSPRVPTAISGLISRWRAG